MQVKKQISKRLIWILAYNIRRPIEKSKGNNNQQPPPLEHN